MTNERHEDVPDQIHWCDAVLAATDVTDARKAQMLYAAAMDYFGKYEIAVLALRDRTTEVDALKEALKQILWQADATVPLSVRAASIASEALGSDCLVEVPYETVRAIGSEMERIRRREGPHGDWEGLPRGRR